MYETCITVLKMLLGSVADMDSFITLRGVTIVYLPTGQNLKIMIPTVTAVLVMGYSQILYFEFLYLVSF